MPLRARIKQFLDASGPADICTIEYIGGKGGIFGGSNLCAHEGVKEEMFTSTLVLDIQSLYRALYSLHIRGPMYSHTALNNLLTYLDPVGVEPSLDEGEEEGGDTLHLESYL